ncbi:hypothetical protein D3C78_1464880 [compost metagenome]
MWGTDLQKIKNDFGTEFMEEIIHTAEEYIDKQWLTKMNENLVLTKEGKLYADMIAGELFIT